MFRSDRLPHKLSHGILALRTEQRADPFGVSSATRGFAGFYTHLDGDLAVALEPLELSGSLLDDLMLDEGSDLLSGERDGRRQRHSDGARSGIF